MKFRGSKGLAQGHRPAGGQPSNSGPSAVSLLSSVIFHLPFFSFLSHFEEYIFEVVLNSSLHL